MNKHKPKLEKHILIRNGKKYISLAGLEMLKVNECSDDSPNGSGRKSDSLDSENELIASNAEAFEILKKENEFLRNQIIAKDKQIDSLTDALSTAQRLNENNQALLKKEQERNQLLLEAAQAPQEATKVSFFSRVFRK
jgi:hypothetical protein